LESKKNKKPPPHVKPGIIKSGRFSKEEQYIAEQESKLIKEHSKRLQEAKEKEDTERLKEAKQKAKELHYMKCPKCGMDLKETIFMEIMVDICEECHGMWLDKGEVEELMFKEADLFTKLCCKLGIKKKKSKKK